MRINDEDGTTLLVKQTLFKVIRQGTLTAPAPPCCPPNLTPCWTLHSSI